MKETFDKMLKHPFVTVMVVGSVTTGIVNIIRALSEFKKQ